MALHPAENRGYRELYAYARQMADHWSALAARVPDESAAAKVLRRGADTAAELIEELAPAIARHGLHGGPAAQTAGRSIARGSRVRDRFLERNQAVRLAVEDAQHLTTLLAYLSAASSTSANTDLAELTSRWERRLKRLEGDARRAAVALGSEPDGAIEPLDPGPVGRAAHGAGFAVGSVGEWVDRRVAGRRRGR